MSALWGKEMGSEVTRKMWEISIHCDGREQKGGKGGVHFVKENDIQGEGKSSQHEQKGYLERKRQGIPWTAMD